MLKIINPKIIKFACLPVKNSMQIAKLPNPCKELLATRSTSYQFCQSTQKNTQKIKNILTHTKINKDNKLQSILDSQLVVDYQFDSSANKVVLVIDTPKDFVKIKNFIKNVFNQQGFTNVQVSLAQKKQKKVFQKRGNLNSIKKIVAVSSCKGGVGKSTIAVNIAFGLKNKGFKVGIFDADIYGPSLPTLVNKQGQYLQNSALNGNLISPKIVDNVKCMSFGFVASQPATIRGPMASSIMSQLLFNTEWQDLDYLIIDMPPGTGDINSSLCEELKIDGAVIVTTPQRLSFIDVMKGLQMFKEYRVRVLTIIQNMSYYECVKCHQKDEIFGKGHTDLIINQLGIQNCFKIPLTSQISKLSDIGVPAVQFKQKDRKIKQVFESICSQIDKQLQKPKNKAGAFYDTTQRLVIVEEGKNSKKINSFQLRCKCKCPECFNAQTNESKINRKKIDPQVYPVKIQQKGNYAVGLAWSDGHKNSLFSYKRLFSDQIPSKK